MILFEQFRKERGAVFMMQLLETGKALYVLAGLCLMGILTRGLTRRLYKGLLKESTTMVFQAVEDICRQFDLSCPIWLDSNINDFKLHAKTRFTQDSFIESIDFDSLEIHVIEE